MRPATVIVGLVLLLASAGCSDSEVEIQGGHPTAEKVFHYVIADPVPAGVRDLQGWAETWQGYEAFLRFVADDEFVKTLLSQGYTPTKWDSISFRFQPSTAARAAFSPAWNPEDVGTKECYVKTGVRNAWTHEGETYLLIDRSNRIVYICGVGA